MSSLPHWRRSRQWRCGRSDAAATTSAIPFPEGPFRGERRGPAGVTEEHLPGPKTARFSEGRSPTRPMSQSSGTIGVRRALDRAEAMGLVGGADDDGRCDSGRKLGASACLRLWCGDLGVSSGAVAGVTVGTGQTAPASSATSGRS